jgi:DNA-binding MarR family transcriptional regulator
MTPNHRPSAEDVAGHIDGLLQEMAHLRTPEFLDVSITMAQAKVLHVVATAGDIHMSALVQTLGVSLSTVSGLVDRLVEHGYVTRRDDPADRRQVLVSPTRAGIELLERFRDLNGTHLRTILGRLVPADLAALDRGVNALADAARELRSGATVPTPTTSARKDRA